MIVRMTSIGAAFDPRRNSLNVLRLTLATAVIVSHSYPLGGFKQDPQLGDLTLGQAAVCAFFVVSGYLITRSRFRRGIVAFAWARILRIFPGFWLALAATAFIAAPMASAVRGGWTFEQGFGFISGNFTLRLNQFTIGDTLVGLPYPDAWNGSLWTLMYEFNCYVLIGVVLIFPWFRKPWALVTLFLLSSVFGYARQLGLFHNPESSRALYALLVPFFLAGAVIFVLSEWLPNSIVLFAFSVTIVVVALAFGWASSVAPLPLAYACIWIGINTPDLLRGTWLGRNDISYGMYVYAFPVQQLIVVFKVNQFGPIITIVASIAFTIPLAVISWKLVEQPMMTNLAYSKVMTHLSRTGGRRLPVQHIPLGSHPNLPEAGFPRETSPQPRRT